MDKQARLQAVGIVRQALSPLVKEWIDEEHELSKVAIDLVPLLDRLEKRIAEQIVVDIPGMSELVQNLHKIEKKDIVTEVKLPELTKLVSEIDLLTKALGSKSIADYRTHDQDESIPGTDYYGYVHPDGSWYIVMAQKGEQRYAAGSGNYPSNWDKRSKLGYGYLNDVL